MHEMSIAMELLEQVLATAAEHEAIRIDEVEVEVGALRAVVPEALELAFQAAGRGTIAENARLTIKEEKAVAVCRSCECMFLPEPGVYVCPQCSEADARIVSGNDILLRAVACETSAEVPSS